MMKTENKILVGGQALRNLGSDRPMEDTDYLIFDETSKDAFLHKDGIDYLNAHGNKFFREVYEQEKGNIQATPQGLLELKCYAFVQHCQNFNFAKADACEYDIKFLVRNFGVSPKIVKKYVTIGELTEIMKIIDNMK